MADRVFDFHKSQLDEETASPLQRRFYKHFHGGAAPPPSAAELARRRFVTTRRSPAVPRVGRRAPQGNERFKLAIYGLSSCKRTQKLRGALDLLPRRDALGRLGYKFRDFTRISDQLRSDLAARLLDLTEGGGTIHMPVVDVIDPSGGAGALLVDPAVEDIRAKLRSIRAARGGGSAVAERSSPPPRVRLAYDGRHTRPAAPRVPPPPPSVPPPATARTPRASSGRSNTVSEDGGKATRGTANHEPRLSQRPAGMTRKQWKNYTHASRRIARAEPPGDRV